MQLVLKILWFFVHLSLVAIIANMLGSLMSQRQSVFITLGEGVLLSLVIISIFLHAKNLIIYFKKQTKQ